MILLFCSRTDRNSILLLDEIFGKHNGYVWFNEHIETGEWLDNNGGLTANPNEAMQFDTQATALAYSLRTANHKWFIQTEHEFL